MVRAARVGLALAALAAGSALADAAPLSLTAGPYEASGDTAALTRRGASCMARILKPGFTTAPTLLNVDAEAVR